jgi:hypothetical protein
MTLRHIHLSAATKGKSTMKKFTIAAIIASGFAAATMAFTGAAAAAPIVNATAADAVATLMSDGYAVQFNGIQRGPLAKCTVTGVHGLDGRMMSMEEVMATMDPQTFGIVYLDITCPSSNN